MMEPNLRAEWAWTQIEAWADGSVSPENRARMAAAIAADPRLAAAVERARAVRAALRAPNRTPMPRGLRRRLLAIANREPRARSRVPRWLARRRLSPLRVSRPSRSGFDPSRRLGRTRVPWPLRKSSRSRCATCSRARAPRARASRPQSVRACATRSPRRARPSKRTWTKPEAEK